MNQGSSLNYIVDEPDVTIDDPHSVLKKYEDNETSSGNCVLVIFLSFFFFLSSFLWSPTEQQLTYIFYSGNFVVIVDGQLSFSQVSHWIDTDSQKPRRCPEPIPQKNSGQRFFVR